MGKNRAAYRLLVNAGHQDALEQQPLFSDETVFLVSTTHPLAHRRSLSREDLKSHPLLSGQQVPIAEAQAFMRRVFGRARPKLQWQRFPLTEAVIDFARAGLGIAIMSEWIASTHLVRGDLVAKRLSSGPLLRPWRIAWRKPARDAALRLQAALSATVPSHRIACAR